MKESRDRTEKFMHATSTAATQAPPSELFHDRQLIPELNYFRKIRYFSINETDLKLPEKVARFGTTRKGRAVFSITRTYWRWISFPLRKGSPIKTGGPSCKCSSWNNRSVRRSTSESGSFLARTPGHLYSKSLYRNRIDRINHS